MTLRMTVLALAMASITPGVQAQESKEEGSQNGDIEVIKISEWHYEPLYETGGFEADSLMDREVFGPDGDEIGSIENVIIGEGDRIVAVIAQVGGFWDIGDTHIAVPWEQVELTEEGVRIPVTEENAEDYGLFESVFVTKASLRQITAVDDDVDTGLRTWKLTNLLDDYATLDNGEGYGYVDNIIFSRNGEIQAVIISSIGDPYGRGPYAYPYYGFDYGWDPRFDTYVLPYGQDEISNLKPFDYDRFDDSWYWD